MTGVDVSTVGGNVASAAALTLTKVWVGGNVTAQGAATLTDSRIRGTLVTGATCNNCTSGDTCSDLVFLAACNATGPVTSTPAGAFECLETGLLAGAAWIAETTTANTKHRLYTKLAGTPFTFDVVALKTDGTVQTNYVATGGTAKNVKLELVDGAGSTACVLRTAIAPAVSQGLSFGAADAGRKTAADMTVGNAYADLRCRVTDASQTPTVVGCTSDNFAVRLATFVVARNTPTLNAGSTFTLPASSPGTGTGGIIDSSFTSVDGSTDCVAASAANTPDASGKYGCLIGQSAALTVGRFFPDHFDITPAFVPGFTAGGFTYMNQPFTTGYTVTAKSMARTTPGSLDNTALALYGGAPLKLGAVNAGTDLTLRLLPVASSPPTPGPTWTKGSYTVASRANTTFSRPSLTTPDSTWRPYDSLDIGVAVDDAYGAGFATGTPGFMVSVSATCQAPTSSACKSYASLIGGATTKIRLGRLKLSNAYGSEQLDLPIPIAFEYWTLNGWQKNSLDICTVLLNSHFAFDFIYPAGTATKPNNLAACDSALTVTGSAPAYVLSLSKPGSGKSVSNKAGWVTVTLNLGAVALGSPNTRCTKAGSAGGADIPANMSWLQNSGMGQNVNSSARATFGIFKSPLIYRRENF